MQKRYQYQQYNPLSTPLKHQIPQHQWLQNDPENIRIQTINDNQIPTQFIYKKPYREAVQIDDLDQIYNLREFRNKNTYESDQIIFLKEKLIQTHNKLIKQLDNNNKLSQRLMNYDKQLKNSETKISQLQNQIKNLQNQIQELNKILMLQSQKTEQKYKVTQYRYHDECKKNIQLKQQLETLNTKMMQHLLQKNNLEENNKTYQNQINIYQDTIADLNQQLHSRTQQIYNKDNDINILNKKLQQLDKELQNKINKIQEYKMHLDKKNAIEQQLKHMLKLQQQRNNNLFNDIKYIQNQNTNQKKKNYQLDQNYQKIKSQLSWLINKNDLQNKNINHQITKKNQQIIILKNNNKDLQHQIHQLKRRPIHDAEKKRRHYQITRQFVHQLQSQQQMFGNSLLRNSRKNINRTQSTTPTLHLRSPRLRDSLRGSPNTIHRVLNEETLRNAPGSFENKSPSSYSKLYGYIPQRKILTHSSNNIKELQSILRTCSLEKRKIKNQIDKIDQLKVKTREMKIRRKRLDEQYQYQEEKIKKITDDIRKLKYA